MGGWSNSIEHVHAFSSPSETILGRKYIVDEKCRIGELTTARVNEQPPVGEY